MTDPRPAPCLVVECHAAVRSADQAFIREERHALTALTADAVPDVVLQLVRLYWPEASLSDIQWSLSLDRWDGTGKISWSTCAEIDGAVYREDLMDPPHV